MADEQQLPEEVVTQEPDAPLTEVEEAEPEPTTEPEVDWKAQAERLEQQLKTEQGRNRKREETDALLGDRLASIEQSNAALITALAAGDTEALPKQLGQIQAQQRNTARGRNYQTQYTSLTDQLKEVVDGTGLDLYESPELEGVRQAWVAANKSRSLQGLYSTLVDAHNVVRQTERSKAQSDTERVREEERKAANLRLEEAGIYDLDTGPARGGVGSQDDWTWFTQTYGKMENPSAEDHARATRINKRR
jgi:hypothetical protein